MNKSSISVILSAFALSMVKHNGSKSFTDLYNFPKYLEISVDYNVLFSKAVRNNITVVIHTDTLGQLNEMCSFIHSIPQGLRGISGDVDIDTNEGRTELQDLQEKIWDDLTINLSEEDLETIFLRDIPVPSEIVYKNPPIYPEVDADIISETYSVDWLHAGELDPYWAEHSSFSSTAIFKFDLDKYPELIKKEEGDIYRYIMHLISVGVEMSSESLHRSNNSASIVPGQVLSMEITDINIDLPVKLSTSIRRF